MLATRCAPRVSGLASTLYMRLRLVVRSGTTPGVRNTVVAAIWALTMGLEPMRGKWLLHMAGNTLNRLRGLRLDIQILFEPIKYMFVEGCFPVVVTWPLWDAFHSFWPCGQANVSGLAPNCVYLATEPLKCPLHGVRYVYSSQGKPVRAILVKPLISDSARPLIRQV